MRTVYSLTNRLRRGIKFAKPKLLNSIVMKWKLNDAYRAAIEAKYECTHAWRETKPLLIEYGVSYRFDRIWSEEKLRIKEELNSKKVNKIAHHI